MLLLLGIMLTMTTVYAQNQSRTLENGNVSVIVSPRFAPTGPLNLPTYVIAVQTLDSSTEAFQITLTYVSNGKSYSKTSVVQRSYWAEPAWTTEVFFVPNDAKLTSVRIIELKPLDFALSDTQ